MWVSVFGAILFFPSPVRLRLGSPRDDFFYLAPFILSQPEGTTDRA